MEFIIAILLFLSGLMVGLKGWKKKPSPIKPPSGFWTQDAYHIEMYNKLMYGEEGPGDSEDAVDTLVYYAYGPGKYESQVKNAIIFCGAGWHTEDEITKKLPDGIITRDQKEGLAMLVKKGNVLIKLEQIDGMEIIFYGLKDFLK